LFDGRRTSSYGVGSREVSAVGAEHALRQGVPRRAPTHQAPRRASPVLDPFHPLNARRLHSQEHDRPEAEGRMKRAGKGKPTELPRAEQVPHSIEAERLTIREVLLHGAGDLLTARIYLTPADFFDPRYSIVFAALCDLQDSGAPVEIGAVRTLLEQR